MSLQAAWDFKLWGVPQSIADIFAANIGGQAPGTDYYWTATPGLTEQVRLAHEYNCKHWTVLMGGSEGPYDFDPDTSFWGGYYPISRMATPEEIKLEAWLSVACNTDGINWYRGMSDTRHEGEDQDWALRGLLEWAISESDDAELDEDIDFCHTKHAKRTPRYYAAKEVCNQIHEIAPILESLDFIGTTASKAFEVHYPQLDDYYPSLILPPLNATWCDSTLGDIVPRLWNFNMAQRYDSSQGLWTTLGAGDAYVQLSAWKTPGTMDDDYWFLVVNRRALANEKRKIQVELTGLHPGDYWLEYLVADSSAPAIPNTGPGPNADYYKLFEVILDPGEAELIHFMPLDTSDLVIQDDTLTLKAPAYYNRNIILDNAKVTIVPDTAIQHYTYIKGTQIEDAWKDSLEILFAPGKGIRCLSPDSGYNKLSILGNDSTQIILKCSKGLDNKWKGIELIGSGYDTLELDYVDVRHATGGIFCKGSRTAVEISNCSFVQCGAALLSDGPHRIDIHDSQIEDCRTGLFLAHGGMLSALNCIITRCDRRGILAADHCTLDLEQLDVSHNQGNGILTVGCDTWLKCCRIDSNDAAGLDIASGSLLMADVDSVEARFGANWVIDNGTEEIRLSGLPSLFLEHGFNSIYDPTERNEEETWINWLGTNAPFSPSWGRNYWNGITGEDSIRGIHIVGVYPELDSILTSQPEFCYLPTITPDVVPCIVEVVKEEIEPNLETAKESYKDLLKESPSGCQNKPAVSRLISVDFQAGNNPDETYELLDSLSSHAADSVLMHVSMLGKAFSLAENYSDPDSAAGLLQDIVDASAEDIDKRIDGQVGLLALDMRMEEEDTVDGLTVEEIETYIDSLDQILAQRFVWSDYTIADSVVMYAPMRVDSQINIMQPNGCLTIVPRPGAVDPTVRFVGEGSIIVHGWDDASLDRGKLFVHGEADDPVSLDWNSSTYGLSLESYCGFVDLKHAILRGNCWLSDNSNPMEWSRDPIFYADSCTFSGFGDGLMLYGVYDSCRISNCTFESVGANGAYYSGVGTAICFALCEGIQVQNCKFIDNGNIGIFACFSDDLEFTETEIRGSGNYGFFNWSATNVDIDCGSITDNGDTLPELWIEDGSVNLVGGHTVIADSGGTLLYTGHPSYADIEDGENKFELYTSSGNYLRSGDTTAVWDVTYNAWAPLSPADSGFFGMLYPSTPSKWTTDSSLASFVECGGGQTQSIGNDNLIVVPSDELAGTDSWNSTEATKAFVSEAGKNASRSNSKDASSRSGSNETRKGDQQFSRSTSKSMQIESKHKELVAWRAAKDASRAAGQGRSAPIITFVKENPKSPYIPAAITHLASLAQSEHVGISDLLAEVADEQTSPSIRHLALRKAAAAKAFEGHPGEAVRQLEELIEHAPSGRDSILTLADAIGVYYAARKSEEVKVTNPSIVVNSLPEFRDRIVGLAGQLENAGRGGKDNSPAVPTSYTLYQNYPNPFNPNTEIRFDIPEAVRVELKVFNILGQEVTTFVDDLRAAGAYRILWDGKNAGGLSVASGVYVYQIKAGNFQDAKKMVLLR